MPPDARYQSRVLALDAVPRIQKEALAQIEPSLRTVCEALPPTLPRDVCDALLGLLAARHLTADQYVALTQTLAGLLAEQAQEQPRRLVALKDA